MTVAFLRRLQIFLLTYLRSLPMCISQLEDIDNVNNNNDYYYYYYICIVHKFKQARVRGAAADDTNKAQFPSV